MASGDLQAWNCEASGWTSRSVLVRFVYSFSAFLIICWKLDDGDAMREESDIMAEAECLIVLRMVANSWGQPGLVVEACYIPRNVII